VNGILGAGAATRNTTAENRLDVTFRQLAGRSALILYVTGGYPDLEASRRILPNVAAEADVIELGIPFSDPVADGPVVQRSSHAALEHGATLAGCLESVRLLRQQSDTPIVLMTYYNPVIRHGLDRFAHEAREAGADGVIAVDLPSEEARPLAVALKAEGLHLVPLVAPTSTDQRIERAAKLAGGFIYCVSLTGVTGVRDGLSPDIPHLLERVRRHSDLPRAVGFGISTPGHARDVARVAEGVVIGSALVDLISRTPKSALETEIRRFAAEIRAGMAAG